jgi:hypothetical protein
MGRWYDNESVLNAVSQAASAVAGVGIFCDRDFLHAVAGVGIFSDWPVL